MEISLQVDGARLASEKLLLLAEGIQDFTPIWPDVAEAIKENLGEILETSGGDNPWSPLAPSTLKRARQSPRPFDTLSHDMWDSLVGWTGNSLYDAAPLFLRVGTVNSAAHWHQTGTSKMPERSIWRNVEKMIGDVSDVLEAWLRGKI